MTDDDITTIPEFLDSIDYDPRAAARSVAVHAAMVGLGVVIGAVFTAVLVGQAMEPVDALTRFGSGPAEYRLTLAELLRARDYVALVGLATFLGGAFALGALEAEWV